MTDYPWWHEVEATAPLMQGDLIEACPVAVFKADLIFDEVGDLDSLLTALRGGVGIQHVRSIVMTQACDLAEQKVRNAILCPAPKLEDFQKDWEEAFTLEKGRQPKPDEWKSYIKNIKAGRAWNFTLLRKREPGDGVQLTTPTTIVDFHEVFSLPVTFLSLSLRKGGQPSTSAQTAIPGAPLAGLRTVLHAGWSADRHRRVVEETNGDLPRPRRSDRPEWFPCDWQGTSAVRGHDSCRVRQIPS